MTWDPTGGAGSPRVAPSGGGISERARTTLVILVMTVLALIGIVAILLLRGGAGNASQVTLEPTSSAGANPFMAPVGTDQAGVAAPPQSGGTFAGNTPGLYGGTRDVGSCDPQAMVAFLQAYPDRAAAWAGVLAIRPIDISGFVAGLTPVILRSDTAVTNHGFAGGRATTVPAVLQAGTAVLVDQYGAPVVKCYCGNPLTWPQRNSEPVYVGPRWPTFSLTAITVIQQTNVVIDSFTLVDPAAGVAFSRVPGTRGEADQPGGPLQDPLPLQPDDPTGSLSCSPAAATSSPSDETSTPETGSSTTAVSCPPTDTSEPTEPVESTTSPPDTAAPPS